MLSERQYLKSWSRIALVLLVCQSAWSCSSERPDSTGAPPRKEPNSKNGIVGSFSGRTISSSDLSREINKLPPSLREQFGNNSGKKELVRSIIDKRLLVEEARRRKIQDNPDIRQQVTDLEERLIVQSLLASEEKAAGTASEKDLRAYYEAHKNEFEQPERSRIARILVATSPNDPLPKTAKARDRIEKLAQRLRSGEPISKLAMEGDGPEREHGGEIDPKGAIALSARPAATETGFVSAATALKHSGEISPVFACREGLAVLQLIERHEARIPPFEEVKNVIEAKMAPIQKRQVFDDLLAKLRRSGNVHINIVDP